MTFGTALIQLLSAAIAGALGGWFVLLGVRIQFRRQSEAACRALLLEVRANYEALVEMMKAPSSDPWPLGKANPGWLSRSVWDAQLPYVAQALDPRTLELVVRAYATLDSVPEMRLTNFTGPGVPYAHGGWINDHIGRAYDAFRPAKDYLGDLVAKQDSRARLLPASVARAGLTVRRLFGRSS